MDLLWDIEVLDVLADGYNIRYGARSIRDEVRCELPLGREQHQFLSATFFFLLPKLSMLAI